MLFLILALVLPFGISLLIVHSVYKNNNKFIWIVPAITFFIFFIILIFDIYSIPSTDTIKERIGLYFLNDVSISFSYQFLFVLASIIITLFYYLKMLISSLKQKNNL